MWRIPVSRERYCLRHNLNLALKTARNVLTASVISLAGHKLIFSLYFSFERAVNLQLCLRGSLTCKDGNIKLNEKDLLCNVLFIFRKQHKYYSNLKRSGRLLENINEEYNGGHRVLFCEYQRSRYSAPRPLKRRSSIESRSIGFFPIPILLARRRIDERRAR